MEEWHRLKGKFTQRWLANSDEFYSPIFVRLFYAQFHYLDRKGYTLPPDFLTAVINADKEGKDLTEVEGLAEAAAPIAESLKAKGEDRGAGATSGTASPAACRAGTLSGGMAEVSLPW